MKIVITGAAGCIGSVVALRAKELGHSVIALDSYERGLNAALLERMGVTVHRFDCLPGLIRAYEGASPRWEWGDIDAVVHLAAGTGSLSRPIDELLELNREMALRVLADSRALGSKVFLWPTTSLALSVPDSPYVKSKELALEKLVGESDVIPLRFFNVAGSYKGLTERRRSEVHLLPAIIEAALRSEPFKIFGDDYDTADGTPSRDFVNLLDVADAILALASNVVNQIDDPTYEPFETERQADGCVWFGTGHTTTALQATMLVEQATALHVELEQVERRAFDTGEIRCERGLEFFQSLIGRPLTPPHISIRDEAETLLTRV